MRGIVKYFGETDILLGSFCYCTRLYCIVVFLIYIVKTRFYFNSLSPTTTGSYGYGQSGLLTWSVSQIAHTELFIL